MIDAWNQQFGINDRLAFSPHTSGLTQGVVSTDLCQGHFFLLGGHLASFQPVSAKWPIIFMSEQAVYELGKPIRGGVPICFPWFGPHPHDENAPAHGLVRTQLWTLVRTGQSDHGAIEVELGLDLTDMHLRYQITFGEDLRLQLCVCNTSQQELHCELALHTYFQLSDIGQVLVRGLENVDYYDKLTGLSVPSTGKPITFDAETDRVYSGAVEKIVLEDPAFGRTICVRPLNSASTVVWNPWIDKSKRLSDFGDQEYRQMCCIETARIGSNNLHLPPLASTTVGVEIGIQPSKSSFK